MEVLDLVDHLSIHNLKFTLATDLWDTFNEAVKNLLDSNPWYELKYLDDKGNFNSLVNKIPNNVGGIYIFYISSNLLKNNHNFLCYIGRAHNPTENNLRKRIKEYKNYYNHPDKLERPKLRNLFAKWGKYVVCRYFPVQSSFSVNSLKENLLIDFIEEELINKIIPPCNDRIPNTIISNATIRAFQ